MSDFVHLHVHSHYSIMDSIVSIKSLIRKAVREGMEAVALTDHGNMFGAVDFYSAAKESGVKPIIGYEAFFMPKIKHDNNRPYHSTLLAENSGGYRNLIQPATLAYTKGFGIKPCINHDMLRTYHKGLICLSGCSRSIISEELLDNNYPKARKWALEFRDIFGVDNFYLELQRNHAAERERLLDGHIKLSKELGIPVAATNNVHYISRNDAEAHSIFMRLNTENPITENGGLPFKTDDFYFRTAQEMGNLFSDIPEAVENTVEIASRCNLELDFNQWHMPTFENKEGISSDSYLEKLCFDGLKKRYKDKPDDAVARLEHELQIIKDKGFADYFLVVRDFIQYAEQNGIPAGPGRGSASGSLVNYALGITRVDPLKYELVFERFLNEGKNEPPDIDTDISRDRREEVIEYIREKHGKENAAGITAFGFLSARGAIHKAAGVLGIDSGRENRIAEFIPDRPGTTLKETVNTEPELEELSRQDPEVKKVLDIGSRIEGLICSVGAHAAGVVIPDNPITEYTPLFKRGDILSTQYDQNALEKLGLIKMDFLGLVTLTVIDTAVNLIKKNKKEHLDINTIPLNEKRVYEMLSSGDTAGVFQFESKEMQDLVKKLNPDSFNDIAACISLYRPGPLGAGMADRYIERKHGRRSPGYIHRSLEPVLKSTHGLFLYQEQIIRAAHEIAGFSLDRADALRKDLAETRPEIISRYRDEFITHAVKNGIDRGPAEQVFNRLKHYSPYAFSKAHAVSYGLIGYRTAYLKAMYPGEYRKALEMNSQ